MKMVIVFGLLVLLVGFISLSGCVELGGCRSDSDCTGCEDCINAVCLYRCDPATEECLDGDCISRDCALYSIDC